MSDPDKWGIDLTPDEADTFMAAIREARRGPDLPDPLATRRILLSMQIAARAVLDAYGTAYAIDDPGLQEAMEEIAESLECRVANPQVGKICLRDKGHAPPHRFTRTIYVRDTGEAADDQRP